MTYVIHVQLILFWRGVLGNVFHLPIKLIFTQLRLFLLCLQQSELDVSFNPTNHSASSEQHFLFLDV